MPKVKTRKTIAKRIKITKSGKMLRGHQNARHRRFHKSKKRIRRFKEPVKLSARQNRQLKSLI